MSTSATPAPLLPEPSTRAPGSRLSLVPGTGQEADKPSRRSVRERLELLLDGEFSEIGGLHRARNGPRRPPGDGVVTGHGQIHGQQVFVFAQDFSVVGGSLGEVHASRVRRLIERATEAGAPVIGLFDGGGARIQEGVRALHGCGEIFHALVSASGVVPLVSVVLGPCAGAAAYAPALSDFVFMLDGPGMMYLTGPDVVRQVTGESITGTGLGGAAVHGERTGLATFVHTDEPGLYDDVRYLVSMLPPNNRIQPEPADTGDSLQRDCSRLNDIVPANPAQPYDVREVIDELVDQDTFLEIHERWATNVICGLARLDGEVVGIVANQPIVLAGALDISASEKAARWVRFCDAFQIPLVTLVDVPGFLPGTAQEHGGVLRHGAKLLHAYCQADVPRVQVIMRKAYGGAYIVMDSPSVGADLSLAWPTNEVAVLGAPAAVDIVHRRELAGADDPDMRRAELEQEYREQHLHPQATSELGLVDSMIEPSRTRAIVAEALRSLRQKQGRPIQRKHSNYPL